MDLYSHSPSSPPPPPPPPPPAPAPPQNVGEGIVLIAYFFIFYFFVPISILFALIYYLVRDHLWEFCCYYDAESALESQQPQPADIGAAAAVASRIPRFTTRRNPPCGSPFQPPPATSSPERIGGVAASCTGCAICTAPLEEEGGSGGDACTTLPLCGHRFHKVCVYHWLNRKATCPVCRRFYPFPVRPKIKILLSRK